MQVGIRTLLAIACIGFLADAAAAPPAVDKWSLWSGPAVKLRGANFFQRRVYPALDNGFIGPGPFGPPFIQQDFDRLAALGANFVNLSVPGLYSENPPYVLDVGAQTNLDNLIAMASLANLYVVISFRTGPGRDEQTFEPETIPESYKNETVWTSPAAQDAWVAMWTATAMRYKGNPAVAGYDLMVEPNGNASILNLSEPAAFYPAYSGTLVDWNQLHPRISAGIRTVDLDTPILTGGMDFSSINWLTYLAVTADPKTVYTVHYYEPMVYTHQNPPNLTLAYPGTFDPGTGMVTTVNKSWLLNNLAPIDTFKAMHPGKPVAVNEFGIKRWEPGAGPYFSDVVSILEEKGANRALWLWGDSYPGDQTADEFTFRHGPDPLNHWDVPTSSLIQAVVADFARNAPICATIALSPSSLPAATVGRAYTVTFSAAGGAGPYEITEAGPLAAGLVFANGSLTGTAVAGGSFPIVVTAKDAKGCLGSQSYLLVAATASGHRRATRH